MSLRLRRGIRRGLSLVTKAGGGQLAGGSPVAAAGARVVARKEPRVSAFWCGVPGVEVWGSEEGAMGVGAPPDDSGRPEHLRPLSVARPKTKHVLIEAPSRTRNYSARKLDESTILIKVQARSRVQRVVSDVWDINTVLSRVSVTKRTVSTFTH